MQVDFFFHGRPRPIGARPLIKPVLMFDDQITNSPTVAQKPASAYEPIGFLLLLPVLNRILTSWREQRARDRQAMTEQGRPAGKPDSTVSSAAATATEHLPSSSFYIDGHPLAPSHIHPELYTGLEETRPNVPPPRDLDPDAAQTQDDHHPPRQLAHSILPVSQLANPDRQCPLCLAPCGLAPEAGGTCVTECGHVFCWSCIEDWAAEKVGLYVFRDIAFRKRKDFRS